MKQLTFCLKSVKKSIIAEFLEVIEQVPDSNDSGAIGNFITYLNRMLRIKSVTPPMVEIMSILKHQKPTLYHATRMLLPTSSHLTILFQIDMNPSLASERLAQFVKKQM